ncbi:MAG: LemA family protein [Bacteroidetes bacterium]|nr:LemA family protein [Bacteroidota bacterium]
METYIILGVIVILVIYIISIYNRLVRLRNNRENAFADIDVQLKQRHDLIPQLVDSVKGYMKHEEGVLTKVTKARTNALAANTIAEKIGAEKELTAALSGLTIAVEAYPELKANENFMQLQGEISDIENKLAAVRRYFNSATKELNNAIQVFPSNLLAGPFGFVREEMFDLGDEEREELDEAPKIKFD